MKRLLILLALIFIPTCQQPGTAYAQQCSEDTQLARLSPAIVGGGVPAVVGCTEATAVDLYATEGVMNDAWGDASTSQAYTSLDQRYATKVVPTETVTITSYRIWAESNAANDTYSMTCEMRTDDGGPSPTNGEANYIAGTRVTVAVDTGVWSTDPAERTFLLSSPVQLSSGTYWFVCGVSAWTDGGPLVYKDTSNTGSTFSYCSDATTNYTFGAEQASQANPKVKLYGCAP